MKKIVVLSLICLGIASMAIAQDTTSKEMVGKYKFPSGSVIEEAIVTWENGVLTMSSSAGVSVLERMKGDTFNVVSFSGTCIFKRNETKKITGVHVDASGYVMDGEKDPVQLTNYTGVAYAPDEKKMVMIRESQLSRKANAGTPVRIYN